MIKITEIFPNPEGADGNKEWIELTNITSDQNSKPITITGWILDDSEKGSKPFTIPPLTIQPNQSTLLQKTETKLNLNNTQDEVRLFDENQNLIDKVSYDTTIQSKAYALQQIKSATTTKTLWQWAEPTPNQPNQTLYQFSGQIIQKPEIKDEFQFTFQPSIQTEQTELTITFTENTLDYKTASLTFTPGTSIQILAKRLENSRFHLIDYHIRKKETTTTQPQTPTTTSPTISNVLPITILIILIIATTIISKLFNHHKK